MLELSVSNPTELWIALGRVFFGPCFEEHIEYKLGDRRFVSTSNHFIISQWPENWEGKALFELVGYSPNGYKMDTLRRTYVDEERWMMFKDVVAKTKRKGFSAQGMNFKMTIERKGGCLSSLHLVRNRGENLLFVHGKIAEIPRKFVADLLLVQNLISELKLGTVRVHFMYSVVYYSIVSLRAYLPVLGKNSMYLHGLPIFEPRNYQASIIKAIEQKNKELIRKYGKERTEEGLWKKIDGETGNWKE